MEKDRLVADERKIATVGRLGCDKKVIVNELWDLFAVSGATIGNDLRELEQQGLLVRPHGGAIPRAKARFELGTHERHVTNRELKHRIARKSEDTPLSSLRLSFRLTG